MIIFIGQIPEYYNPNQLIPRKFAENFNIFDNVPVFIENFNIFDNVPNQLIPRKFAENFNIFDNVPVFIENFNIFDNVPVFKSTKYLT